MSRPRAYRRGFVAAVLLGCSITPSAVNGAGSRAAIASVICQGAANDPPRRAARRPEPSNDPASSVRTLTFSIDFRADPDASGPTAWTWLRDHVLPTIAGWPSDLDPRASVGVRFDAASGLTFVPATAQLVAPEYARCVVRATDDTARPSFELRSTCSSDGHERWQLSNLDRAPLRVRVIQKLLATDRPDLRVIDVAALVASLAPTAAHAEDPLTLALTRGAVECGEVMWRHERAASGGGWIVHARSPGGLLLPALLALLADLESHGGGVWQDRSVGELEQWTALAFAARDGSRIEATAQLARLGERAGLDVLERLLWADDRARPGAMDALIRAGAADSLPAVIAAAHDDWPWSKDLARAAVANLWRSASPQARRATELQLGTIVTTNHATEASANLTPQADTGRAVVTWLAMLTLTIVLIGTHGRAIFGLGRRAA